MKGHDKRAKGQPLPLFTELPRAKVFSETHAAPILLHRLRWTEPLLTSA